VIDGSEQDHLSFLVGMKNPEDIVPLPGNRWIVASGMAAGSGLHLIDAGTKKWERWIAPPAIPRAPFEGFHQQPVPDELQLHGLSLRVSADGRVTLYAVNHGGREDLKDFAYGRDRETIEVFDIDMSAPKPKLTWAGCVPLPNKFVANAVVPGPGDSLFATVLFHPGTTFSDLWQEKPTGGVYRWEPGMPTFEHVEGADLPGNNGIEISPDGKVLYVVSLYNVTAFSNTNPAKALATVRIPDGIGDNIHWIDGRLIVAGVRTDLGPRADDGTPTGEGYYVATVDPDSLELTIIARGPFHPEFTGASTGVPISGTLWIGSHHSDRLAYRPLPASRDSE
jgi:hypothetical protein